MYCSTCGAFTPGGRSACDTCGAQLGERKGELPRSMRHGVLESWSEDRSIGLCPRCRYSGEGITYFSRGAHVAGLVGATLLTAGIMGAGGAAYYFAYRDHRVCPRCGKNWGKHGEHSMRNLDPRHQAHRVEVPGSGGETGKRVWSWILMVLGAILVIAGVADFEIGAILLGAVSGGGGLLLRRSAREEREARRAALMARLQLPVLKLAADRGGRLTVTEVAAGLGWTLSRAEKVLESLEDGLRVSSEVTDEGLIVYEFRELAARAPEKRLPGEVEPD